MPLFLTEPDPYGPGGPDGKGWNRLSLNAHLQARNQCGLLPIRFASLFESRTGRQRWGGYERCHRGGPGHCGTCPVYLRSREHQALDWPAHTPLLLARAVPWPATPGALLADPAAGRSDVHLRTWRDADTGLVVDWPTLRNALGFWISWLFWDEQGHERFWLVRAHPDADATVVRTEQSTTHTRHALYGGADRPRLAVLSCHGGCAHDTDHLRYLAADLADRPADAVSAGVPDLPDSLPGVRGVALAHTGGRSVIHHNGSTTTVSWDIPFDAGAAAALAAHAVRLTPTF